MSDKPRDPKVLSERPARIEPQTTRTPDAPDAPGVLSTPTRATPERAQGSHELDDGRVIQGASDAPAAAVVEMYTPQADVTETDANGSVILIAAGGVPIPMADARRLGIVKDAQKRGPQETKG